MYQTIYQTIPHLLHAHKADEKKIVRLVGKTAKEYSWKELLSSVAGAMRFMQEHGVKKGSIIPLMRHFGLSQIRDFLAAICLGAKPVLLAPPNPKMAPEVFEKKLSGMLGHLRTESIFLPEIPEHIVGDFFFVEPQSVRDVAFIQHSSGTSGVPKAIGIRHDQLLAHMEAYKKSIALKENDAIVSWLPLYHDMGLIACLFGSLCWDLPLSLMSNFEWVTRPISLFHEIVATQGSLVFLPNFAFALLTRQKEPFESRLDGVTFISCSEPIHTQTIDAFCAKFAPNGVTHNSIRGCYAMAEAVFAVTQSTQNPPSYKGIVSSGRPIEGIGLRLRDNGEILLKGPWIFDGYYNTALQYQPFEEGWYCTGDVGHLENGELFVIGRVKDMIIVGGRNVDPNEIELLLSTHNGVIPGRVCCFGRFNPQSGTEEIHVIAEVEHPSPTLALDLKNTIAKNTEHQVRGIWLKERGFLIKSSSGKMARKECKEKILPELAQL